MKPSRIALGVLLTMLAGFGPTDPPPPYVPPAFLAQPPTLPAGYDAAQALSLDLPDALSIAMKQNLDISLTRKDVRATDLGVDAAKAGMYEPTLTAGYTHTGADRSGTPASDAVSLGVSQGLPTGGHISLDASTTWSPISPTSSTLSFSITQPLLRGFSPDLAIPRYAILSAKIASEQERHQLEISAASLVQRTEGAYWDVVLALYSYDVTVASKQLADDTVNLVQRKIAAGLAPTSDLTGAQNQAAQKQLSVITSAQSVEQSWDALRTVMNLPRDQWNRPLLPTDRPHFTPGAVMSDEEAYRTAVKHRPEVAQSDLDLEASTLELRKAHNDGLPQIDLGFRGSVSHQSGNDYSAITSEPTMHDPAGWSGMVTLSWTPLGRGRKINNELAKIHHEVRVENREIRIQGIWNEVRASVRAQRAAQLEVVAASDARTLAKQTLDLETQKYLNGSSSNLDVANLQNGLANAELQELQALLGHERAATATLLSTGQLLHERHIDLQVVR